MWLQPIFIKYFACPRHSKFMLSHISGFTALYNFPTMRKFSWSGYWNQSASAENRESILHTGSSSNTTTDQLHFKAVYLHLHGLKTFSFFQNINMLDESSYAGCPGGKCARLRENVPYVKVHRYNPKHIYPKLNGYGDNGERSLKVWQLLHIYWLPNTY